MSSRPSLQRHGRPNPSFSSTLLDSIYRSIDANQQHVVVDHDDDVIIRTTKHRGQEDTAPSFRRSCMIDTWMDKKPSTDNLIVRCKSMADHHLVNSSSSSSSSSSDSDSTTLRASLKPIRTTLSLSDRETKTKSRPFKPISPGGRLATFLNSMFTKKSRKPNPISVPASTSTCSSASSFSRSCLTKTPSSNNTKRSVRFVDQPPTNLNNEETKFRHDLQEKRRVHEAALNLLNTYRQNQKDILNFTEIEDEDDDDDASCASSDLFELDNLSAIGMDRRYGEELPVYETTHPAKNRPIRPMA